MFDEIEFTAATTSQVGIWLRLYVYCARHENGGIILNFGSWSDDHCQRILGVNRAALNDSPLWQVNCMGRLNLEYYNLIAEQWAKDQKRTAQVRGQSRSPAKQAAARKNGSKGGRPQTIIYPQAFSSNSANPT